jgi:hypothetical protein
MSGLTLSAYGEVHAGQSVIVCGCGPSLNELAGPERFVTIGVNDVGRLFDPTYLVVVNPRPQFRDGRFQYVERSKAKALFTQLDLGSVSPPVVRFRLGQYGGTEPGHSETLHYTQNSPYVAVCLAAHMGARRIGLIGVDLTDDHFFGRTGRHPLAGRLGEIDAQYGRLGAALSKRGVELVNLSPISRLTSLPRVGLGTGTDWVAAVPPLSVEGAAQPEGDGGECPVVATAGRVFFVHHRFLSCGDVFRVGLRHAAEELGVEAEDAYWDDATLPDRVRRFDPELLFVVHGRNFVRRWGKTFAGRRSAVWLVDEPYEVDDSSRYAASFSHVFVNDPATLALHHDAHYLPVCHDPRVHSPGAAERRYQVGFVGGANAARERALGALAGRGLLDYVVGGPWKTDALRRLCRSSNVKAEETAELYRATRIVVNVFRDVHHFNRRRIAGTSLNPRVYEALACGALVVSERRPEIEDLVPELPTFGGPDELVARIEELLADPGRAGEIQAACARRLTGGTYAERLKAVMSMTRSNTAESDKAGAGVAAERGELVPSATESVWADEAWETCGPIEVRPADGGLVLRKAPDAAPGSERGLASRAAFEDVDLSFEALITPGSSFIVKVLQADKLDQSSNSYHLFCGPRAYVARHGHVLGFVDVPRNRWERFRMTYGRGWLAVSVSDRRVCHVQDRTLQRGHAFLGLKGGEVRLRNVRLGPLPAAGVSSAGERLLHGPTPGSERPRVSVVTTVYDRTDCLRRCLRSVRALTFRDYEHIVVSDHPPEAVVDEVARIVREEDDGRVTYLDLPARANNWGIAPAAAGLRRSRGDYVSFLSDDNGYLPDHLEALVEALDRDAGLGFVYSSCLYAGRAVLRHPVPRPGAIDLGQPLFRRELFSRHLGDDLPFNVIAWDWALVDALVRAGVRWRHLDRASFVFRLAAYPHLLPALS